MRFLLHILPILLGDVLNGNEFFECLLLLHDICALILSPLISEEQIPLLRLMIQQYLTDFKEQYQCNLPPKFHFLVHFPQQIIRYCYTIFNNLYASSALLLSECTCIHHLRVNRHACKPKYYYVNADVFVEYSIGAYYNNYAC